MVKIIKPRFRNKVSLYLFLPLSILDATATLSSCGSNKPTLSLNSSTNQIKWKDSGEQESININIDYQYGKDSLPEYYSDSKWNITSNGEPSWDEYCKFQKSSDTQWTLSLQKEPKEIFHLYIALVLVDIKSEPLDILVSFHSVEFDSIFDENKTLNYPNDSCQARQVWNYMQYNNEKAANTPLSYDDTKVVSTSSNKQTWEIKTDSYKNIYIGTVEFTIKPNEKISLTNIFPKYYSKDFTDLAGNTFSMSGMNDPTPDNVSFAWENKYNKTGSFTNNFQYIWWNELEFKTLPQENDTVVTFIPKNASTHYLAGSELTLKNLTITA